MTAHSFVLVLKMNPARFYRRTGTLVAVLARLDEHCPAGLTKSQCGRADGIGRVGVWWALMRLRLAGLITVDRIGQPRRYQRISSRPAPKWAYVCERCYRQPAAQHDSYTDQVLCWDCIGPDDGQSAYHCLMIGNLPEADQLRGRPVIGI
jgi:hypothetical protein